MALNNHVHISFKEENTWVFSVAVFKSLFSNYNFLLLCKSKTSVIVIFSIYISETDL